MTTTPLIEPSFAAGELTPSLYGRVDLAKYQVGLRTLVNWFVRPYGGVATRAGTAFVGEVVNSSQKSRLYPFQFSQVQTYVLEFASFKMRVIMNGGYVLETPKVITGITRANPGVVTSVAHGLSNGDDVWIVGVSGMTQVNRRRFTIANVTANTFELSGVDTSSYGAWTSGGTASRFYTLAMPYAEADLYMLKFVQSADTLTITHPTYPPANLTRTSHTSWTIAWKTFQPDQAAPTVFVSSVPGPNIVYAITAENDVTGEESRGLFGSSLNETSTLTWTAAAGATFYNVYKVKNGVYGFIGRATQAAGFTDATIAPDISRTVPYGSNPFNAAGLYPGCSTYHEGRQWYARTNTQPQTLWATQSASFNNMDTSMPSADSDAIVRTIASRKVDEIRFLVPLNHLLVFTSGAVWKAWSGINSDVITPSNCNVKVQGAEGAANIEPISTVNSVLYVTTSGRRVRDLAYDSGSDTFAGKDLTILSQHIFEGKTIADWTYARDPDGLVWVALSDGTGACLTYLREHDVTAWSRWLVGGFIESVAAIQENEETILYMQVRRTIGGVTKRYVERMPSRYFATIYDAWCVDSGYRYDGWNTATLFLTISGATYNKGDTVTLTATGHTPFTAASVGKQYILRYGQDQVTVTVTGYTSTSVVSATLDTAPYVTLQGTFISDWALATTTLDGLWHLEGQTVKVFADGSVMADAVVTNGQITVSRACGRILAGLAYTCQFETLDVEQGQPTMQGRYKRISEVVMRVRATRGLAVGPTADRLTEIKERTTEQMGYPTTLTTGDERILIDPSWNSNGRIFAQQTYPLPAEILAVIPRFEGGE